MTFKKESQLRTMHKMFIASKSSQRHLCGAVEQTLHQNS